MEKVSCPTVYCPKEKRRVPIYWCLGSFMQQREICPNLIKAMVSIAENHAEVECKLQGDDHSERVRYK